MRSDRPDPQRRCSSCVEHAAVIGDRAGARAGDGACVFPAEIGIRHAAEGALTRTEALMVEIAQGKPCSPHSVLLLLHRY